MLKTVSAKLAAPFALFLVPIAFLLYFLADTHDQGIATARNEISGLPSIVAALDLTTALMRWNGPEDVPRVHAAGAAAVSVMRRDAGLWPQHADTTAKLQHGASLAEVVLSENWWSPDRVLEIAGALSGLIQSVADSSALILDPELDTYYLMDILVTHAPAVLNGTMLLHTVSHDHMASRMSAEDAGARLEAYRKTLEEALIRLQRAHASVLRHGRDEVVREAVDPAVTALVAAVQQTVQENPEAGGHGHADPFEHAIEFAEEMSKVVSSQLGRLLSARINGIEQARDRQVIVALSMFVAAVCIMLLLISLLVRRPVTSLTRAMLSLADGNVNIQLGALTRADEIGAMSRAVLVFKDNAIRRAELEERSRQAAEALAQTAATLHRAERIGGLGNWSYDFRSHELVLSPSLYELLGLDPARGVPQFGQVLAQIAKGDRSRVRALLSEAMTLGRQTEGIVQFRHPRRGMRHLRVVIDAEIDAHFAPVTMVGAVLDITKLKHNERLLEARSEALAEAQAMGRIGNWSYRFGEVEIEWSPELFELMCFKPEQYRPRRADVLARCRNGTSRLMLDAEAEVMRTRGVKAVDITLQRGDGSLADFTLTCKAELTAGGQVIGVFGTLQDISERKNAERELEKLAYYDPLSGLANRALFQRAIRRATEEGRQSGRQSALLMLDLDRFKEVNDSLGHHAGDELLVKVSELLRRLLPQDAFLARLGGDEFAAIINDCDREKAVRHAEKVIVALSEPVHLSMGEVSIGTSIGIALTPTQSATEEELLGHADLALYRAKDSGRACAQVFKPEFSDIAQDKIRLARDLSRAVHLNEGLYLVYQPQIDLASGAVSGFEALLRWTHPTRGNVPPSDFIPIAESSKLISELGLWVLREACRQISLWRDGGQPLREVAINLSAAQFWHSDIEQDIAEALERSGIPPNLLCIEVTESVFVREAEGRVRKSLDAIRSLGIQLALDDFGTGYSSLAYLHRFPFDKLKIDRTFIDGVDLNPDRLKLLEGIVSLGRALGKKTIAEGAEREGEVAALVSLGCDMVQGYVFSRPLRADEAMERASQIEAAALEQAVDVPSTVPSIAAVTGLNRSAA